MEEKIDKIIKKLNDLEAQITQVQRQISGLGEAHNFTVLDKKIKEKIDAATKEILEALNR